MLTHVNFGEDQIATMPQLGIDGCRVDVPTSGDLRWFVTCLTGTAVRPLFIEHDVARNEPLLDEALSYGFDWFDLEVHNEPPGMDDVTLEQYISDVLSVHRDARLRGFQGRIISGGLINCERSTLDWYRAAWPKFPADVVCGFHRYPPGTQTDRSRAWPPFDSRDEEMDALVKLANGHALACTEFGYHTFPEQSGGFLGIGSKTVQLTDQQVYEHLIADLRLFHRHGVDLACVYQWRDGPTRSSYGNCFGLHTSDGSPKRQLEALKDWKLATA